MENKVWVIFQEINKHTRFVGVYSTHGTAKQVVEDIINAEEEQDYRLVDNNVWYGTTRKIEILPKVLDNNPVQERAVTYVN